jgi:hypothetical protein
MVEKIHLLIKVMEAQYHRDRKALQSVIEDELHIRKELKNLQERMRAARQLDLDDEPEMRAMGADVVWERWLEKSRASLNLRLATILATKEMHLTNVRKSFGKVQAANAKSDQILQATKKRVAIKNLEKSISLSTTRGQ